MTFELHTDIPAPEARTAGRKATSAYPFADMVPGQSFFKPVEVAEGESVADAQLKAIRSVRSAATRWNKISKAGAKFRVDAYTDAEHNAFAGCWRVA